MAVPRAKKKDKAQSKAFNAAVEEVKRHLFPDFILMILLAFLDELKYGEVAKVQPRNFTVDHIQRLIKGVSIRFDRYCGYLSDGWITKREAMDIFKKMTDTEFDMVGSGRSY